MTVTLKEAAMKAGRTLSCTWRYMKKIRHWYEIRDQHRYLCCEWDELQTTLPQKRRYHKSPDVQESDISVREFVPTLKTYRWRVISGTARVACNYYRQEWFDGKIVRSGATR